jgi:hypothetical protein
MVAARAVNILTNQGRLSALGQSTVICPVADNCTAVHHLLAPILRTSRMENAPWNGGYKKRAH